jgi:hypothetical protein
MTRLRNTLKQAVTQVGAACSLPMLSSIESALNYLWVGRWMREQGFRVQRRAESLRCRTRVAQTLSAALLLRAASPNI